MSRLGISCAYNMLAIFECARGGIAIWSYEIGSKVLVGNEDGSGDDGDDDGGDDDNYCLLYTSPSPRD